MYEKHNIKVAFVSHFNHFRMGGQQSMLGIIENLDQTKFTPYCILPSDGELAERLRAAGCRCFFVPLYSIKPRHYCQIPGCIKSIHRIITENHIDIIHPDRDADATVCGIAKIGTGAKMVWHVRVAPSNPKDSINSRLSDGIIAVSEIAGSRFANAGKKLIKIYNGIDTATFTPVEDKLPIRQQLGIPSDKFIVMFVGQIVSTKGIYDLINAAELMRGTVSEDEMPLFIILGTTDCKDDLVAFCNRIGSDGLNSHIKYCGHQENIQQWIQATDILVLPSQIREGMGRVMLEAMSCGVVPVGSDLPGINEAITQETGLLVKEKSPEAIANAIIMLKNDRELMNRLGANGRRRAEKYFEIKHNTRLVEQFYCSLLN